ncbi:MAG TPA: C45 family peptidase [Kofleriaceae bacterium]|nr:C45 family peptidase [Kofleriaceae bacterium]
MRVLELPAGKSPREWGRIHGESFRGEIQALAQLRSYLCTKVGGFQSREQVLAAARAHLPVLERFDAALHAELCGIAEGAAVSPEDIVVANHYTDLRDLDPDPASWRPAPIGDGCSVIFADTRSGRVVAQTWDMHATAIPYVMVLALPDAKLLSVTGCLGMAGMNRAHVAIAINNLFSTDATVGVVWPALVRRALRESTAEAARDVVLGAPIGSGHHYFLADPGQAYGIESSGTKRRVVYHHDPDREHEVAARYYHTNHALDPDIAAASKVPPTSTTFDRMRHLEDGRHARLDGLDDAWRALGSEDGWPRSVCTNMATPEAPHGAATCGAIAMNVTTGELWAQQGFIHNVAPERFHV